VVWNKMLQRNKYRVLAGLAWKYPAIWSEVQGPILGFGHHVIGLAPRMQTRDTPSPLCALWISDRLI
jgi:hypothetical protein